MSDSARGDLRQQLESDLIAIQESFADYIDCIQESLREKGVNLGRLQSYLLRLPCGRGDRNLMLLTAKTDALRGVDDIYGIFIILSECTSFLNYYIFEKMVKKFDIDESQKALQYPTKLREYIEKHTISEFIELHPVLNSYTDGTKELVLILDIEMTCKFSKIVDLGRTVAHIMNLDQSALLIHNIGQCCVIVTFLIPNSVADIIFTGHSSEIFSLDEKLKFQKLSVQELKCNGYTFDFVSTVGMIPGMLLKVLYFFCCLESPLPITLHYILRLKLQTNVNGM